jgi:hypothetical protein
MQFDRNTPVDPADLIMLLQKKPNWRLDGQDRIRVLLKGEAPLLRAGQVKGLLKELRR